MRFADRQDAGRKLSARLHAFAADKPLILALPRGGVPVAREIAEALHAPVDMWIVRKIGAPHQPELGIGAVAEGGALVLDQRLIRRLELPPSEVEALVKRAQDELRLRIQTLRRGHEVPDVAERTVILVDDGIATGSTMRAAIQTLKHRGVRRLIVAVPVAAAQTVHELEEDVDAIICLHVPEHLGAIGQWYDDFTQVSDDAGRVGR